MISGGSHDELMSLNHFKDNSFQLDTYYTKIDLIDKKKNYFEMFFKPIKSSRSILKKKHYPTHLQYLSDYNTYLL